MSLDNNPTPTPAVTREFVTQLMDRFPAAPETYASARGLILDALGVAVAGTRTEEGRTVLAAMTKLRGGNGEASVVGTDTKFDIATAALINGTLAYSLGLTDTHSQSISHPGCSVVATALTVAEMTQASDQTILDAVVAGVETVVRVGSVVNPTHRGRGFHPTATCNPFGSALTASILLGSTTEQALNAMGVAGSTAGGLYEFRHTGGMLMALHGGLPAHSGIVSAVLAGEGFTGPTTVLEGPDGFFAAFADAIRLEQMEIPEVGAPMGVQELSLRPYNACRYAHSGIDALAVIRDEHGEFKPEEVASLVVYTHGTAVEQEVEPVTLVAARLSTAFTIASTYIYGPSLEALEESDLVDSRILEMLAKVEIKEEERLTKLFPKVWASRVVLTTTDGREFEAEVHTPKGEPDNPLTRDDLVTKFKRLAVPVLGEARADFVASAVLDGTAPLHTVLSLLTAAKEA